MAADLGTLKDGDVVVFLYRASVRHTLSERVNVLHEAIAFRLAIAAFLVRQ